MRLTLTLILALALRILFRAFYPTTSSHFDSSNKFTHGKTCVFEKQEEDTPQKFITYLAMFWIHSGSLFKGFNTGNGHLKYISQTDKSLEIRMNQQKDAVRLGQANNAVYKYVRYMNHVIDWSSCRLAYK